MDSVRVGICCGASGLAGSRTGLSYSNFFSQALTCERSSDMSVGPLILRKLVVGEGR